MARRKWRVGSGASEVARRLLFCGRSMQIDTDEFPKPEKRTYEGYGDIVVWIVPFRGHRRSLQSQIELENAHLLTSITQKNVHLTSIFGVHSVEMMVAGSVRNCIFTMMEWAGEKDLFDIFMEDMTVWTDCRLLLKLYEHMKDALLFMHKNGLSHLDVKPENIMYTRPSVFKRCTIVRSACREWLWYKALQSSRAESYWCANSSPRS